ncbi:MAG TPA: hypothetical protein VHY37_06460, partial [Tepidisphaeraceae bacterium]|nr:hypothetical protein [Tepidisphaeraceae bacterium]
MPTRLKNSMMRLAWVMLPAIALGPAGAIAQTAQPAPLTQPATQPAAQPAPEVLALIAHMGGQGFENRQHAEQALIRIGTPAEPALRQAADDSSSPEIRARAAAAIVQIEQNLADEPTYITLHV